MPLFNNDFFGNYCTILLSSLPGLNFTTFLAAIVIGLPVWGFLPVLAFLFERENEPKPTRATLSPFLKESVVVSTKASIAFLASAFVRFAFLAIESISCALFITVILKVNKSLKKDHNRQI